MEGESNGESGMECLGHFCFPYSAHSALRAFSGKKLFLLQWKHF